MAERQPHIPKAEQIGALEHALDSTVTEIRPYVQLAKGAILGAFWGAYDGWVNASQYRALQRDMARLDVSDFSETPRDTQ